jgi:hypothetical protein
MYQGVKKASWLVSPPLRNVETIFISKAAVTLIYARKLAMQIAQNLSSIALTAIV